MRRAPSPKRGISTASPMVDSYRIQHAYFVDAGNPEYKGPWNQIVNIPRVYTPALMRYFEAQRTPVHENYYAKKF